ncbi:hypothetical protein QUB75_02160 [Microcoleus sp. K1-B6]|uniref:hypothetical protein n=1 Tax=unclassified Microcoleus TaxID=2642155 RepID=UPI002FD6654D
MPVPQNINFLVEQASCLLLTMVQDIRRNGCQEEGRSKREEGRGKREEGRRKRENYSLFQLKTQNSKFKPENYTSHYTPNKLLSGKCDI